MPHRYICTVLDEMRDCLKTNNFSYLHGLIEEAQMMGNRMESRIYEVKEWEELQKEIKELEAKLEKMRAEEKELDG